MSGCITAQNKHGAQTHISLFQSIFLQGLPCFANNLWVEDPEVLRSQRNIVHHLPPEPQFGPEALLKRSMQ